MGWQLSRLPGRRMSVRCSVGLRFGDQSVYYHYGDGSVGGDNDMSCWGLFGVLNLFTVQR